MDILLQRENSCKLFRSMNKALLLKYLQLRTQYLKMPPPNNQIISSFKKWKGHFTEVIDGEITKMGVQLNIQFEVKQGEIISKMIELHRGDQQFLELFRNVNSSIETLKDFIRSLSIKDPASEIQV